MESYKRILIADDDVVLVQALTYHLSHKGYIADGVYDGEKALELLSARHYDLFILDMIMPYFSGMELLFEVKKMNSTLPVIIISTLEQKELIDSTFETGTNAFLVKPVNLDLLISRVEELLEC